MYTDTTVTWSITIHRHNNNMAHYSTQTQQKLHGPLKYTDTTITWSIAVHRHNNSMVHYSTQTQQKLHGPLQYTHTTKASWSITIHTQQ